MRPTVPAPEACVATARALRAPIAIVGLPFDPVTLDQAVDWVTQAVRGKRPQYGVTANVDFVVQALGDGDLRRIIFDAHLVLGDGMPIVWASRWLGDPLPERVAGSDLMPRLLAEAERAGWRVYLLGSTERSLQEAVRRIHERHPALTVCGADSPPFAELADMDHAGIARRIRDAQPDLLFVALGCPKQEKWIHLHYQTLGVPFCLGIGASIDFIAGTQKRAPVWMQRVGLEWFHRVCREPRRLARRYLRGSFVFGSALARQILQMRSPPRAAPSPPPALIGAPPIPPPLPSRPTPPDAAATLVGPSRLDAAAAHELAPSWQAAMEQGACRAIDLSGCEFIDSTGVGLLVRMQKTATRRERPLTLLRPHPRVVASLRLMRIEAFFTIERDAAPGRAPSATP